MPLFAQQSNSAAAVWGAGLLLLVLFGTLFTWLNLGGRYLQRKPILPAYRPRRLVPWTVWDLLLIIFFYVLAAFTIQFGFFLAEKATGRKIAELGKDRPAAAKDRGKTTEHPLAQLLKDKDPAVLALAFIVGAVVVPISEEVFFRALVQGWLEAAERRKRRRRGSLLRAMPPGMPSIAGVSLLFASLHFRSESPQAEEANLVFSFIVLGSINLLTLVFSLGWLHWQTGADAQDFGWDAKHIWGDLASGTAAFFAIAVPIYALQIDLTCYVLPAKYASDPITLFFFACVLGLLYFRTHRIVPSIVLHIWLNASSLAMAWAGP
jgi:membrane protease YdiL (CAAX protease family)